MFESRFENAHIELSQFMREHIENELRAKNTLRVEFELLHNNIEMILHHQIAMNYAQYIIDDENAHYVVIMCARDNYENQTLFEIVNAHTMQTMHTFVVYANLKIQYIDV